MTDKLKPRACPHCGLWMAAQPKETPRTKKIVVYWECWNSQCGKGYSEGKLYIKEEPSAQKEHPRVISFLGTPITELSEAQKEKCIDWIAKEAPIGWYYLRKAIMEPETLNKEDIEHLAYLFRLHSDVLKGLIDD